MAPPTGTMQSFASSRPRPAPDSFSRRAPGSGSRVSHASLAAVIETAARPARLVSGRGHARGRITGGGVAVGAASPPCLCHRCGERTGRRVVAQLKRLEGGQPLQHDAEPLRPSYAACGESGHASPRRPSRRRGESFRCSTATQLCPFHQQMILGIRPPPVRDNCAEVRALAHHFGEKNIWLDSGESHEASGGFVFFYAFPFSRYEMGPEDPLYQFVTDRVRIAWNRTLQSHKLTKNRSICASMSPQLASGSCLAPQQGAGRGQFERVQTRVQHKPAQCTSLLDPPRARFSLAFLVNAR